MKTLFFLIFTSVSPFLLAASFSSFSEGKIYSGEGRWYKNGEHSLFRINEGNANEENIAFDQNAAINSLEHSVKYKLCFKIKKDCHMNCSADLVKNLALLKPWDNIRPWISSPEGAYSPAGDKECP